MNMSVPIVFFGLMNSGAGNFSVASVPDGVPSSNQFTYNSKGGLTTVTVDSYTMYPVIQHSRRGKALIYFMFAINWILTLCSIITTSVIFNREGQVKDSVALLPITVILAVPAIRDLYPGSPPFGIYLDTHQNRAALLFRGLTLLFRRGGILPTDVHSGGVHRYGFVVLFKGTHWEWGNSYPWKGGGSRLIEVPPYRLPHTL